MKAKATLSHFRVRTPGKAASIGLLTTFALIGAAAFPVASYADGLVSIERDLSKAVDSPGAFFRRHPSGNVPLKLPSIEITYVGAVAGRPEAAMLELSMSQAQLDFTPLTSELSDAFVGLEPVETDGVKVECERTGEKQAFAYGRDLGRCTVESLAEQVAWEPETFRRLHPAIVKALGFKVNFKLSVLERAEVSTPGKTMRTVLRNAALVKPLTEALDKSSNKIDVDGKKAYTADAVKAAITRVIGSDFCGLTLKEKQRSETAWLSYLKGDQKGFQQNNASAALFVDAKSQNETCNEIRSVNSDPLLNKPYRTLRMALRDLALETVMLKVGEGTPGRFALKPDANMAPDLAVETELTAATTAVTLEPKNVAVSYGGAQHVMAIFE